MNSPVALTVVDALLHNKRDNIGQRWPYIDKDFPECLRKLSLTLFKKGHRVSGIF